MRVTEIITESQGTPIRDQIRADVKKNGPGEYFVRVTNVDKLGFSARQKFGRSPDMDDPDFDVDYIGAGKGRPALWFYPVSEYLGAEDLYATESPYVWLVKLKDTSWLQPAKRGATRVANPPQGKQRVGIMRHSNPTAAIFFEPGFDVVGKYYDYAGQHKRHGLVKGAPKPTFFDRVRGVAEAFDQPYKSKWEKTDYGDVDVLAKLPDGSPLSIMFNRQQDDDGDKAVQVEFYRNNSQEVTGEGDAQRIFATVLSAIQKYIKKYKPQRLTFSASKEVDTGQNSQSRANLYDKLVQRYARTWGYRAFRADNGNLVMYELSRLGKSIAEGNEPGEYVYHASYLPNQSQGLRSVIGNGLKPSETGYAGPGVYFAYEPEDCYYHVGKDEATMFRVRWSDLLKLYGKYPDNKNGIERDDNEVIVPGTVPAKILEVEHFPGEWWDLESAYRASLGPVDENFGDGKNPGRKGLAKRVGVNTKASVSDLRKTAKNSSGEKQRMAHWMANMKAGKKK